MTGLAGVLRGLAARDGVQGVVHLSGEGLPIEPARASDRVAVPARPEADIGPLLYDLRPHGPALVGLL